MFPVEQFIAQFSGKTIALSVYDLESGREINVNADASFHPASTVKVHVMMEIFHQAEQGKISLEERIPIYNSFASVADGSPFSLSVEDDSEKSLYERIGETETVRELTRLMIVRSGNLATNILLDKIGADNVNAFIESLNIRNVAVRRGMYDLAALRSGINNSASARGLTQTMRLLAEGIVISKQASAKMIRIMSEQEFNESIPALLPKSVKVAHKTGWSDEFYHDTGIVYPENRKPYAISIMTSGFPEDNENEAHDCMADLSRLVYEELVSTAR
ncbi:MAG: serine hydrolase [Anaerolineales bacterium]|nr:serine hydrolase [Anaerolineales bacterium]